MHLQVQAYRPWTAVSDNNNSEKVSETTSNWSTHTHARTHTPLPVPRDHLWLTTTGTSPSRPPSRRCQSAGCANNNASLTCCSPNIYFLCAGAVWSASALTYILPCRSSVYTAVCVGLLSYDACIYGYYHKILRSTIYTSSILHRLYIYSTTTVECYAAAAVQQQQYVHGDRITIIMYLSTYYIIIIQYYSSFEFWKKVCCCRGFFLILLSSREKKKKYTVPHKKERWNKQKKNCLSRLMMRPRTKYFLAKCID